MTVVILEDAAEDLESGAQFFESCETGVGDYFLDSILSDQALGPLWFNVKNAFRIRLRRRTS